MSYSRINMVMKFNAADQTDNDTRNEISMYSVYSAKAFHTWKLTNSNNLDTRNSNLSNA